MKKKILIPFLLLVPLSSCKTFSSLLDVPGAVVADVGGAVETVTPDATAETAGQVAATGTTLLTGNAALGTAAGVLVTGLAAFLLGKRKKVQA